MTTLPLGSEALRSLANYNAKTHSEMMKINDKLMKLTHSLKVAEEEVQLNTVKDSYEVYLESTLDNSKSKLDKELELLREQYEQKVRRATEAYEKTKIYCESQMHNMKEKRFNTPKIRKLKAEIKITEEDYKRKQNYYEVTPLQKSEGVREEREERSNEVISPSSTPVADPSAPKKKRQLKVVPKVSPSVPMEETVVGNEKISMKEFAIGLQNGDFSMIQKFRGVSNEKEFQDLYGFTHEDVFNYQAKLFPPTEEED